MQNKIYVVSLIGNNLIEVECVAKLQYSAWKDYALCFAYTTNKKEIDKLKQSLMTYKFPKNK
jgi:hypothetical protein